MLEMSKERVSRVVGGARLGLANCLRLADELQERPTVVLVAYGYKREAAILERAWLAPKALPRRVALVAAKLQDLDEGALADLERIVDRLRLSAGPTARKQRR